MPNSVNEFLKDSVDIAISRELKQDYHYVADTTLIFNTLFRSPLCKFLRNLDLF